MSGTNGSQRTPTNSSLAGTIEAHQIAKQLMEGKMDPVLLPNNPPAISVQPLLLNQHLKEWHASVTSECRKHLIHYISSLEIELFKITLFPTRDPRAMSDNRTDCSVEYAKKVEGNMYNTANSRSEYFHLIADKIYAIQRELEEKRAERKRVGQTLPTPQTQTSGALSNNTGPRIHGDPCQRVPGAINQTSNCSLSSSQDPSCFSKDKTAPDNKQSSMDETQNILLDYGKEDNSDEDDVEVVLEIKKSSTSTKNQCQDEHKIKVLQLMYSFSGLSPTQVLNDDCLLTGSSLLNLLKEWFPEMELKFLQGISESQAVRNNQASLSDLYESIATGYLGDRSISTETSDDLNSIISGHGITSHFPFIRCRLIPDSLVSEQQRQNTFGKANYSDILLDKLYRDAESYYKTRYCDDTSFDISSLRNCKKFNCQLPNCSHVRLSDTHVIKRIDFIAHPKLFSEYEKEKEKYKSQNKSFNEKLLFHGTHATNLNKILHDNFKLLANPVNRRKNNLYGEGIYFSDFPAKSLKYGDALLLCKVLLGKEEIVQLGCQPATRDEDFKKNFDSRKIVDKIDRKDGPASIYVVPNPQQILPCYVVYLKKKETRQNEDMSRSGEKFSKEKFFGVNWTSNGTKVGGFYLPSVTHLFPIHSYMNEVECKVTRLENLEQNYTVEEEMQFRWRQLLYSLIIQLQALHYLLEEPDLCNKLYKLTPTTEQFLDMLWTLCKNYFLSYDDINNSPIFLRTCLAKTSLELAINETFFGSPPVTKPSPSNKRTHLQVDDGDKELWEFYNEKLRKFGVLLESYSGEQDCTICMYLMSSYGAIKGVTHKRNKLVLTNKRLIGALAKGKNSVFKTKECKHHFHLYCAKQMLVNQPSDQYFECPQCKTIQGIKIGNQPDTGEMIVTKEDFDLPGYGKHCNLNLGHINSQQLSQISNNCPQPQGTFVVEYRFKDGIQNASHPSPGSPYYADLFPRKAYFPNTLEGRKIIEMLRLAFDRKLIFTVGTSATSGRDNVIIWNGIHHKTKITDSVYGYPDPHYLERVEHELNAFGITEADIQVKLDRFRSLMQCFANASNI